MITVSWEQTGDTEKKYLTFEVHIVPQKEDIDWALLATLHPYSTDVAKGATFVGRSEKVLALANNKLLKLARIGAMWGGSANWIEYLIPNHKVDVCAIRTERIVTG